MSPDQIIRMTPEQLAGTRVEEMLQAAEARKPGGGMVLASASGLCLQLRATVHVLRAAGHVKLVEELARAAAQMFYAVGVRGPDLNAFQEAGERDLVDMKRDGRVK